MTFIPGEPHAGRAMIVTLAGSYQIICPEYPVVDNVPDVWARIAGTYRVNARHPSVYSDSNDFGEAEIRISDGVLMLDSDKARLPESEFVIRILGGVCGGEIMERDPATDTIVWQKMVYTRG